MSEIVCSKTSVIVPTQYPSPVIVQEDEEPEETAFFSNW
jgi:hypothetical protein